MSEYDGMLSIAAKIVYSLHGSIIKHWKPNDDPRALLLCMLLKIWLKKSYRDTVSFIHGSKDLWNIIGLKKA
ncbi:MAG: hypothetical protein QW416_03710 [Candidatus Nitrosocaldaceae archaeon]